MRHFLLAAALLAGCDGTIAVPLSSGPQDIVLSSSELSLPSGLDDGTGRIASVPCGPSSLCPPNDAVPLTCEAGVCDPAPITLGGPVGDVIDASALLEEARSVRFVRLESYEIEEVRYEVPLNTLTVGVGPVELFWGPESATAIDPAQGVRRFGTLPRIEAGSSAPGNLAIDEAGSDALGRYLLDTSPRVRLFAQSVEDLEPGQPYPRGDLTLRVNASVTAIGRIF
jgi:hypothetical protein